MSGDLGALPAPMVPHYLDIREFEYMPLSVAVLRDSSFTSTTTAQEFRAGVLIWCASWHQVPAGSVPNNDAELAKFSGFGFAGSAIKEWRKVKAGAMRGWVLCSDGRLYHPIVCEKALTTWNVKITTAWRRECERLRKENKAREKIGEQPLGLPEKPEETRMTEVGFPPENQSRSAGNPSENALNRREGNRTGKEDKKEDLTSSPDSKSANSITTLAGSVGLGLLGDFFSREPDPADPGAPLRLPERLKGDVGAEAALELVNAFVCLRSHHWPGAISFPQSTTILIEQCRPLTGAGVPIEVYADVLDQQMRAKVSGGQIDANRDLKFCMMSLQSAKTKYLEAIAAGHTPEVPSGTVRDPNAPPQPKRSAAFDTWFPRVLGFRDKGMWLTNWGEPPTDPSNLIPVDVLIEVYGQNWMEILRGPSQGQGEAA